MKERPVLFTGAMVRALLAGDKTQTRRIVKIKPPLCNAPYYPTGNVRTNLQRQPGVFMEFRYDGQPADYASFLIACPYGQPGDRLWVRETWSDEHPLAVQDGRYSQPGRAGIPGPPPVQYRTIYRADGEPLQIWRTSNGHPYFTKSGPEDEIAAQFPTISSNYSRKGSKGIFWWPSIHMPRWASRILLEITAVRVEQLQSIGIKDIIAEGLSTTLREHDAEIDLRNQWRILWESTGGNWDENPWVWVMEFRRVT